MKFLTFLFLVCVSAPSIAQETRVTGSFPADLSSIQVLTYQNPFSKNIISLAEIKPNNGMFEVSFPLEEKRPTLFQSGDYTISLDLKPNVSYTINFEKGQALKKASWKPFIVKKITSDDANTNEMLRIRKETDQLKASFKKGARSSKYAPSLSKYLIEQLNIIKNNNALLKEYTNSTSFGDLLHSLKSSNEVSYSNKLEGIYLKNMEFNFSGLQTVNALYASEILLSYYYSKDKNANYFEMASNYLVDIDNKRLQEAIELWVIANAYNFSDSPILNKKLTNFIAISQDSALKDYGESLLEMHSSNIVGSFLQKFSLVDLKGQSIEFDDYKGNYLLIDIWATWCGPCIKSMKLLPPLKEELQEKLSILCISNDSPVDKMKTFVAKNNYGASMDFAYAKNKLEMNSYFEKQAIPLYYLISPTGKIIDKATKDPTKMIRKYLK